MRSATLSPPHVHLDTLPQFHDTLLVQLFTTNPLPHQPLVPRLQRLNGKGDIGSCLLFLGPTLRQLDLNGEFTQQAALSFPRLPILASTLMRLSIKSPSAAAFVTDALVDTLPRLSSLEEVDLQLEFLDMTEIVAGLAALPALRELTLHGTMQSRFMWRCNQLDMFPSLEALEVACGHAPGLPNLVRQLSVQGTLWNLAFTNRHRSEPAFSLADLSEAAAMYSSLESLTYIDKATEFIAFSQFRVLSKCIALQRLVILGGTAVGVADGEMAWLVAHLSQLTKLVLRGTGVPAAAHRPLSTLRSLASITASCSLIKVIKLDIDCSTDRIPLQLPVAHGCFREVHVGFSPVGDVKQVAFYLHRLSKVKGFTVKYKETVLHADRASPWKEVVELLPFLERAKEYARMEEEATAEKRSERQVD